MGAVSDVWSRSRAAVAVPLLPRDFRAPPAALDVTAERRAQIHERMAALLTELRALDGIDAPMPAEPPPECEPAFVSVAVIVERFGKSADAVRKAAKRRKLGASRREPG